MKKEKLDRILQKVGPKTVKEDLAEYGYLLEWVNEFMKERYETDKDFKMEIYTILYNHSKRVEPELDIYFLEHLSYNLNNFLGKTENA